MSLSLSNPQIRKWFDEHVPWPRDRPEPTDEQFAAAEKRMYEQARKAYDSGYEGDWGFSLTLTMATYNPLLWLHLFFPEEEKKFRDDLRLGTRLDLLR